MRVLIVDPERKRSKKERESEGPLSFFFAPDLEGAQDFDLIVAPAELFLGVTGKLPNGPIVMAYGSVELIADALTCGCSDYLRTPWTFEELEARALRFWRIRFRLGSATFLYTLGELTGEASAIWLPEGERKTLELLLHRIGRPVPRSAFQRALGQPDREGTRSVDMQLCRLRKRLAQVSGDGETGAFLEAVRNYGYVLNGKACG